MGGYRENKQFCYYRRESLFETCKFLVKAHRRGLIEEKVFFNLLQNAETLGVRLSNYINSIDPPLNDNQ